MAALPQTHPIVMASWTLYVNAAFGSLVIAVGAWLAWNGLSLYSAVGVAIAAAAFLWWHGTTLTLIWAWSTLLLGLECFAWPVVTMLQIRSGWRRAIRRRDGCHSLRHPHGAFFSLLLAGFFLWPVQTGKGRTGHGATGELLYAELQGQWQHSRVEEAVTVTTSQSDPRRRRTSLFDGHRGIQDRPVSIGWSGRR